MKKNILLHILTRMRILYRTNLKMIVLVDNIFDMIVLINVNVCLNMNMGSTMRKIFNLILILVL